MSTVDLDRRFVEWTRDADANPELWSRFRLSDGTLRWDDLLAKRRVVLYEAACGFTELRLAVQIYAGLVGVALAVLAAEIFDSPDWKQLARRRTLVAGLVLCGFVCWNRAAWIGRENLGRYERTNALDLSYLIVGLGADAVPEWIAYLPRLPPAMQQRARDCFQRFYGLGLRDSAAHPSWYAWNYRRDRRDAALRAAGLNTGPPTPGSRARATGLRRVGARE